MIGAMLPVLIFHCLHPLPPFLCARCLSEESRRSHSAARISVERNGEQHYKSGLPSFLWGRQKGRRWFFKEINLFACIGGLYAPDVSMTDQRSLALILVVPEDRMGPHHSLHTSSDHATRAQLERFASGRQVGLDLMTMCFLRWATVCC